MQRIKLSHFINRHTTKNRSLLIDGNNAPALTSRQRSGFLDRYLIASLGLITLVVREVLGALDVALAVLWVHDGADNGDRNGLFHLVRNHHPRQAAALCKLCLRSFHS